jgi:hypothetical protein
VYRLVYFVLGAAMLAEFFSTPGVHGGPNFGVLPSPLRFLPEAMTGIVAVYVLFAGVRKQFHRIPVKYWFLFGALSLILVCGILANDEATGPVLNGMRYYLRAIPVFFLPAILEMTDEQLRRVLRYVTGLALLQTPISMYQRYVLESGGHSSGDGVSGSLMDSGAMTLILICVICVLSAAMLRKRISKLTYAALFVMLLIPISIDETKVTIFVFPPALLATFLIAAPRGKKVRVIVTAFLILFIGGSIFIPTYNYFNRLNTPKDEQFTITDVITKKGFIANYLGNHATVGRGEVGHVGRINAVEVPLQYLSKDPIKLAFGLGMGNVSRSSIGPAFIGKYFDTFAPFAVGFDSGSFLLETGLLGFLIVLMIHWNIYRDAVFVARHDPDLIGDIAIGWVGTSVVVFVGIFYTGLHGNAGVSYLYWFFSGVVTARLAALHRGQVRTRRAAMLPLQVAAADGIAQRMPHGG